MTINNAWLIGRDGRGRPERATAAMSDAVAFWERRRSQGLIRGDGMRSGSSRGEGWTQS